MFSKKNLNTQRGRTDRFLAPRSSLDDLRTRQYLTNELTCVTSDLDRIHTPNFLYQKKYIEYLDKSFDLKNKKRSIGAIHHDNDLLQAWPCVPRKKRNLELTGSVLDLPTFSYAPFTDILDWGKKDVLVAALGRTYYNWSWLDQIVVNRGLVNDKIQACKIEPTNGNVVTFGTCGGFELHDMNLCKCFLRRCKLCFTAKIQHDDLFCQMTCLDWSPTGNAFALGCTCGIITAYTKDAKAISDMQEENGSSILNLSISPNARYLAYYTIDSDVVYILTWTDLKYYRVITFENIIKTLIWHPWRSSLLCVGINQKTHIILAFMNVTVERIHFYVPSLQAPCNISSALFNSITGELVLSVVYINNGERSLTKGIYKSDVDGCVNISYQCLFTAANVLLIFLAVSRNIDRRFLEETSLLVLSDPYTIVDMCDKPEVSSYNDRIRKMMFSPDGTKLATATAGEDLMIWHFLPDDAKNKPRSLKKFCTLPVYVDCADLGYSVR